MSDLNEPRSDRPMMPARPEAMEYRLARIDQAQAATRRFVAEQNKLAEKASDRRVAFYLTPIAASVAGIGGLIAAILAAVRWVGHG